ncbi:hypothetical protein ACP4OV_001652 [Aristida adscensionis]
MPSRHHRLASLTKQLASHVNAARHRDALALFAGMLSAPDLPPPADPSFAHALPLGLKSATALRLPRAAAAFHALAAKRGLLSSPFLASALVASYGGGAPPDPALARRLFDELPARNAVVWSAMITVHVRSGDLDAAARALDAMDVTPTASCFNVVIAAVAERGDHPVQAIELYRRMRRVGVPPSFITLLAIVPVCTELGALTSIKEVHGFAVRHGMSPRSHIGSSLIEAYGRCGFLAGAQRVFDQVQDRDVVVWSSLVSAYAFHGRAEAAMTLFRDMELDDVRPDGIMFLSLLAACAHAGHADDALQYFDVLTKRYGVEACRDHYSCLVDVLGRAGRLHQAYELIQTMPVKVTAKAWGALLGACRKYGEVGLAEVAGRALFDIEPHNAGNFVSLANIYSGVGLHEEAEKVRKEMEQRGVQRLPGSSWTIHNKSMY